MDGIPQEFLTAPPEVLRYFGEKRSRPSFDWRDVAPEEHAYAFTVAKTTGFDVLEDIRAAVDEAIAARIPFEEFRQRLTPILQEKGWWGRRVVEDPKDGLFKVSQLGSPRRLRTIYWANVRTAHAAGEWERTQRTKAFLPFLLYTLSSAERKRPEHRGWVGTVLPVDDPWWDSHYPPNGWGCKCGVRQISRRDAEGRGYTGTTKAPPVELMPWRNRRTGETVMVPRGIDPGWQTNPGRTRGKNVAELLSGRLDALPLAARPAAVADWVSSPAFRLFVERSANVGLKRAAAIPALRAEGFEGAALARVLDAELPYPLTRFPVAIAPARFGEDYWPVMIDAATIGHAADHRLVPDAATWSTIGELLKRARAKRDAAGTVRLYDPELRTMVVVEPVPGKRAWRVRTVFRVSRPSYFEKQPGEEM